MCVVYGGVEKDGKVGRRQNGHTEVIHFEKENKIKENIPYSFYLFNAFEENYFQALGWDLYSLT